MKTAHVYSFGLLSEEEKDDIRGFFDKTSHVDPADRDEALRYTFEKDNAPQQLRDEVAIPALLKTSPVLFEYMTPEAREALLQELLLAYYTLHHNYQFHAQASRRQYLEKYTASIEQCAERIDDLKSVMATSALPTRQKSIDAKTFFELMLDELQRISAGKTVYLRQWMSDFNIWRLYWVWVGNTLRMSLTLFPDTTSNIQQARQNANAPQQTLGYISWILYYTRFLINFCLLLKHTIHHPWMSEEEQQKGWQARLNEQWQQRKFALINDLIWATTNMVCFFWLVGEGVLGYSGNILTTALLMADSLVMVWRMREAEKEHQAQLTRLQSEIDQLSDKMVAAQAQIAPLDAADALMPSQIAIWEAQRARLEEARDTVIFEWTHKRRSLKVDLYYGVAMCLTFSIMCSMHIPSGMISFAASHTLSILGSGLCSLLTLAYVAYNAYKEVHKSQALAQSAEEKIKAIYQQDRTNPLSELDYLRCIALENQVKYYDQLADHEIKKLMHDLIIKVLFPFLLGVALLNLPGTGVIVAVVVFVLIAAATQRLIKNCAPKEAPLLKYDPSEHHAYNQTRHRLFMSAPIRAEEQAPDSEQDPELEQGEAPNTTS